MKNTCLIEDNVLGIINELHNQLVKGLICCQCPNPCDKSGRCAMALKNLVTTLKMFQDAYEAQNIETKEVNKKELDKEELEQLEQQDKCMQDKNE